VRRLPTTAALTLSIATGSALASSGDALRPMATGTAARSVVEQSVAALAASPRSAVPARAEWSQGTSLETTRRVGPITQACEIRRLREWVRVRCAGLQVAALTQLGGAEDGVQFALDAATSNGLPGGAQLIFPQRAGETRVFQFWTLGPGYDGPLTVIAALTVQSDATGAEARLLLHDALNESVRTVQGERRRLEALHP
jgi:hypothetical protein